MSRDDYLRRQAWDYFALHAQQRLTTVNFYLVVATALTAGAVASFDESFRFPGLRLPTGLLLSLLSFAFWRLDFRNRELIKAAEAALRSFEASDRVDDGNGEPPVEWLFTREYRQSEKHKGAIGWTNCVTLRTYSHVFNGLCHTWQRGPISRPCKPLDPSTVDSVFPQRSSPTLFSSITDFPSVCETSRTYLRRVGPL